jgi:hypothetical protein
MAQVCLLDLARLPAPPLITARDINARRMEWRNRGYIPEPSDPILHEITYELGNRAPKGGWENEAEFLAATSYLFENSPRGIAEQKEAWRVYDKVRRDRRTPLIAKYETYEAMGISGTTVSPGHRLKSKDAVPADEIAALPDAKFKELLEATANPAVRDSYLVSRHYQWVWSETWTPVINDFYLLGIAHGHTNYHFLRENTGGGEFEASVRMRKGTNIELTTMYFERQQLLPFFDPNTREARKVPLDPKTLGAATRRQK